MRPERHLGGTLRNVRSSGYWDTGTLLPLPTSRRRARRVPRLQVYLPDELYRVVKERELPASELL